MPKPNGSKGGSRLTAEERLLDKQRTEILRKQQELEKRLRILPAVIEEQAEQKRQIAKRRAEAATPAISSHMGRNGSRARNRKSRHLPSKERYLAKLTTLALIIILAAIVFMLWHTIPTK